MFTEMKKELIACGIFILTAALSAANSPMTLDFTRDVNIIVSEKPDLPARLASDDLTRCLGKASGKKLTVQKFLGQTQGIFVGIRPSDSPDPSEPNGFIILERNGSIYIYGDDAPGRWGTFFGAAEFLEQVVGVRWLWPGKTGEFVPKKTKLVFDGRTVFDKPLLIHSKWRRPREVPIGWNSAENRKKFYEAETLWLLHHRITAAIDLGGGHAFENYYARFGKTHPEFFNLLPDGTRRSDPYYCYGSPKFISLCVSNPDLHLQIVNDWKLQKNPGPLLICIENDTAGKCTCAHCLALDGVPVEPRLSRARSAFKAKRSDWYKELGSLSNRYAFFYSEIYKLAKQTNPNVRVKVYFYMNYANAPSMKFDLKGVLGGIVPDNAFPWTEEKNTAFKQQWRGWADTGAQLFLRPNYTLDGHNFPLEYSDAFADCFDSALKNNLCATDFDSLTGQFSSQALTLYTIARMHRGDKTKQQIDDEFFRAFDPAEKEVRDYFAFLKRHSESIKEDPYKAFEGQNFAGFVGFYQVAPKCFSVKFFEEAEQLLDKAEAASKSSEEASARIRFLKNGLENARLTANAEVEFKNLQKSKNPIPFNNAVLQLDEFRKSIETEYGCDFGFLRFCESRKWDRDFIKIQSIGAELFDVSWKIAFDPEKCGDKEGYYLPNAQKGEWSLISVGSFYNSQEPNLTYRIKHGSDYMGTVWYKCKFSADAEDNFTLIFGAVDESCKIYLNGKLLLDRPYPYKGNQNSWREMFSLELAKHLLKGENELCVRVQNDSGPGGIWKPVYVLRNKSSKILPQLSTSEK